MPSPRLPKARKIKRQIQCQSRARTERKTAAAAAVYLIMRSASFAHALAPSMMSSNRSSPKLMIESARNWTAFLPFLAGTGTPPAFVFFVTDDPAPATVLQHVGQGLGVWWFNPHPEHVCTCFPFGLGRLDLP